MTPATEARARRGDPITSHEAAAATTPRLSRLERMVMNYARQRGADGFTDAQLQEALGDHGSTYRTRRRELFDRKLIRDTGRRAREAGEARRRIVWAVV